MGSAAGNSILPTGATLPMAGSAAPRDAFGHTLSDLAQGFRFEDGTGGPDGALQNIQSPVDVGGGYAGLVKIIVPAGATKVRLLTNGNARIGTDPSMMTFSPSSQMPAGPQTPNDGVNNVVGSGAGWFPIPMTNYNYKQGQAPVGAGYLLELGVAGMPFFYIGAITACQVWYIFDVNSAL